MRFFEIANPAWDVVSTIRFDKELAEFTKTNPNIIEKLREFLDFRRHSKPNEHFGPKDQPYRNTGAFVGFWHVHLIFGRVIVHYKMADGQLRLCDITSHKALDNQTSLAAYLQRLGPEDFHKFVLPNSKTDTPTLGFSPDEKEAVVALFWDMSQQDREFLAAAVNGQLDDLMEFVDLVVENGMTKDQKKTALLNTFGGQNGLSTAISSVLKQTAQK